MTEQTTKKRKKKPGKYNPKPFNFRVTPVMRERLMERANNESKTVSEVVRDIISKELLINPEDQADVAA
jgi:predicted DNA-binding protein